ncbi:MAG: Stk1 family PASTA domain-containing Ser/Thr kinase [Lachnospiraceae bacterium]|nr:Stk1 family PASTA domain-containing Ser/Thr kinase [Lachnospiraceae bacterium]
MLRAGTFLGNRYEIISRIGSGGMSDVYKATDLKLNRAVAIKVLKSEYSNEKNFVSKFRMEAQSAAGLAHPNIVNVYDVGEDRGVHYIVMELVEGITLKKYIERKKKLEIRESIEVAMQVARGIEAAHKQHIIHRDIKPQNIMISRDGKVKVTDFGIARASSSQTISSNTMGSVHYISPEQARGGYCDERSDIYSLGITLYEMLTGRVPFEGESTVSVALLHIQGEMVPPREYEPLIPVSLEKIILKCTQKKPELRYSSATELISDLKKSLTMPNEDFVRIASLTSSSPTMVFSGDDKEEIERQRNVRAGAYKKDYGMDDTADYDNDDRMPRRERTYVSDRDRTHRRYNDYDDDEYSYSGYTGRDSGMERVITGISIVVALIIVIIVAVFALRGCGSDMAFLPDDTSAAESTGTEVSTQGDEDAQQVAMKNLLGMTQRNAVKTLEDMGLEANVETGPSDDYKEGQVFEQEYREGEMIDPGTVVTIKVSTGVEAITIPTNILGSSEANARSILESLGFRVAGKTRSENSDSIEEGMVINTDPSAGSAASKGASVTLIISEGPAVKEVKVPDITGLSESKAVERLEDNDLKAGKISYEASDSVSKGMVIRQDPEAGEKVEENTSVSFTVSSGSEQVEVPNLIYMSLSEAKSALSEAGLDVGDVDEDYSEESDRDVVISQSKKGGSKVKKGSSIDIVIGKGPKPTTAAATEEPETPEMFEDGGDPDEYENEPEPQPADDEVIS